MEIYFSFGSPPTWDILGINRHGYTKMNTGKMSRIFRLLSVNMTQTVNKWWFSGYLNLDEKSIISYIFLVSPSPEQT